MSPRIHHVQIAIPAGGEPNARQFYGVLLGLTELPKPAALQGRGGLWFSTGDTQLHLGVDPDFRAANKAHVALQVEDLAALRRRLEASGYVTEDDVPLPGYDRVHVYDPFGNRIELIEPTTS